VAGALLLGAACSDDGDPAEGLADHITDEAPSGFRPVTDDDGFPLGAFDLDDFLEIYSTNEADDRELLEEHEFEGGYTRTWIEESTGTIATVIGFEFEDIDGAKAVAEAFNTEALAKEGATEFEVPGLPGATGIRSTQEGEDGTQYIQTVTLVVGTRLFTAAVVGPTGSGSAELVTNLARRQTIGPEDD
jgi:hypothetical protein